MTEYLPDRPVYYRQAADGSWEGRRIRRFANGSWEEPIGNSSRMGRHMRAQARGAA